MVRAICALALVVSVACPCFGQQTLVGTWKIVSWETEYQATGEKVALMGKNPSGTAIYTPEGRFVLLITGEGRKRATTDKERADLWRSVFAHSGTYRLGGTSI